MLVSLMVSLRETNKELREENPKISPENLIITFAGLLERAMRYPSFLF